MAITSSFFGNKRGSRIFDDPFSFHDVWDPFKGFPLSSSSLAGIDWKETPEAHVFKADLPGLQKDEVKVEIEDGRMLQISGEKKIEKEDKNDIWHRAERGVGKFMRRFKLPENVKMDEVKASMENGVLVVNLPKEEVKKSDVKSIDISG